MKITRLLLTLIPLLLAAFPLRAQITETYNFNGLNLGIPDGNPSGLADSHTILSSIESITNVRVTMSILPTAGPDAGAFNGDLYVFLQHGSGFTVLINRPGRTLGDDFGYGDDGIVVTFDDTGLFGEFHVYRNVRGSLVSTRFGSMLRPSGCQVPVTGVPTSGVLTLR